LKDLGQDSLTPLEVCEGIAQASADVSGYRVVLQAALHGPTEGNSDILQTIGHEEVASADPTFFVQTRISAKYSLESHVPPL